MDVGTLLEQRLAGRFPTVWLVRKVEPTLKTAILESQDGARTVSLGFEEVESEGYHVLCSPVMDWPSVSLKPLARGRLTEVRLATLQGETPLRRFVDWIKLDEFQMGGALFLNPELMLSYRDRIIAVHDRSGWSRVPVDIPRDFESMQVKMSRRPEPKPSGPPDLFSHLMDDDP
jgi:hypothetical protein